jgi:hypothetical protein
MYSPYNQGMFVVPFRNACWLTRCGIGLVIRIDVLPDEVLLIIFDFYVDPITFDSCVDPDLHSKPEIEKWISLVHVCRRWRSLVFQSPRRLNLRLFCTPETPARDTLDVWPALPILINGNANFTSSDDNDDVVFALGHNNRVHEVDLWEVYDDDLERILAAMQVPFPKATHLRLSPPPRDQTLLAIPDSFLGGSAPSLRQFELDGIPFPGLSKFLLSTTRLVDLYLRIPRSAYISPEEMVTSLSVLTRLENFTLIIQRFLSHPDNETQRSPLATCSVLSALRDISFRGSSGYLEDLVARIDAPRLYKFSITFNYQPNFGIPQLFKFISRTPALKAPVDAHAIFDSHVVRVSLISPTFPYGVFHVEIGKRPAWHLSILLQVFASSCPLFAVKNLYIKDQGSDLKMTSPVEIPRWREFLQPFVAVKNIYLSNVIAFHIENSLQVLGEDRSIDVLPALQNIYIFLRPPGVGLPDPSELVHSQGPMEQFVAARQLLGQTITIVVSQW